MNHHQAWAVVDLIGKAATLTGVDLEVAPNLVTATVNENAYDDSTAVEVTLWQGGIGEAVAISSLGVLLSPYEESDVRIVVALDSNGEFTFEPAATEAKAAQ